MIPRPPLLAAVLILAGLCPAAGASQQQASVSDRSEAIAIIGELRKIHTPEGIEVLEQMELGGVPQWVSIRGRNRDNPVLLFIHGGPGDPMIGMSWAYQTPWEDYFTVVQWDQRGSGKNAATADREALRGTLTINRLTSDAEELVGHLRERLGKDRIVALGYSAGAALGIHLAKRRPEWLHAYVGVGQVSHDLLRATYERTLEIATARANTEAVAELEPLASLDWEENDPAFWTIWRWANAFDGGWYGKRGWQMWTDLPVLAPEYTAEEAAAAADALVWLNSDSVYFDLGELDLRELGPQFEVPVLFFHGRYDLTPPIESARAYLDWIDAPHKRLVTFERSAHVPFMEEPGRFLVALLEHVLPLTHGAAEFERLR